MTYEPFRAALGVTNTELGTLLGITGFVQVFGYITLGWLQDMLQIRGIIMIDLIVYALLALSLALLPTPPFWWLCVVFAGFGLFGEALYWPTVQKATRGMSGPTHQAALFSTQEALRGAMGVHCQSGYPAVVRHVRLTGHRCAHGDDLLSPRHGCPCIRRIPQRSRRLPTEDAGDA